MKWEEIKDKVEELGVEDEDEVDSIDITFGSSERIEADRLSNNSWEIFD